jgi:Ligand-binding domain of nuclear hormone receptor
MAHLNNYCICTSPPPSVHIGSLSSVVQKDCSSINGNRCGVEMMAFENDMSSAAIVSRLSPFSGKGQVPILYSLLNIRNVEPLVSYREDFETKVDMIASDAITECRDRTDSLDSLSPARRGKPGVISRTSSGGSLTSSLGQADPETSAWNQSEELVEAARTRLVQLSTNPDTAGLVTLEFDIRSHSQPATPPSPVPQYLEPRRKYSVGSRLAQLGQQKILNESCILPVDLSCKRSRYCTSERGLNSTTTSAEDAPYSILKTVLSVSTPGVRRNTVSACDPQSLSTARRHHVTLAKKAFFPVSARIAEQMKRVVKFANSLPEFCSLPISDRLALLTSACPRLLLLYMAEVNLQFAVASMHENGSGELCERVPSPTESPDLSEQLSSVEWPTMQFVENTQSFIRKCNSLQIHQNEYFYMRMITLFHTGLFVILAYI